jgi:N-methylhydantoinase A/oxoprolinase/acetone carboxylase beta subunit
MKLVGVDIGGTFTDFVFWDNEGDGPLVYKQLTSTDAPQRAVLEGLSVILARAGCQPRDLTFLVHATTLATNAVLERRGSRVALLTTRGFRDVLQIQRQKRHDLYNLFEEKPTPLVSRQDTWEVSERVDAVGSGRRI